MSDELRNTYYALRSSARNTNTPQSLLFVACCATVLIMSFVRKLVWDAWNIAHIARHHIVPDEVEAVCHKNPIVLRGQQKGRLVLIGPTKENRILSVVLEGKGKGRFYPITAYDADKRDTKLYYRLRSS